MCLRVSSLVVYLCNLSERISTWHNLSSVERISTSHTLSLVECDSARHPCSVDLQICSNHSTKLISGAFSCVPLSKVFPLNLSRACPSCQLRRSTDNTPLIKFLNQILKNVLIMNNICINCLHQYKRISSLTYIPCLCMYRNL